MVSKPLLVNSILTVPSTSRLVLQTQYFSSKIVTDDNDLTRWLKLFFRSRTTIWKGAVISRH